MIRFCPKDCPERSADCHGKCERYKAKKAEYDAGREKNGNYLNTYYGRTWTRTLRVPNIYKKGDRNG